MLHLFIKWSGTKPGGCEWKPKTPREELVLSFHRVARGGKIQLWWSGSHQPEFLENLTAGLLLRKSVKILVEAQAEFLAGSPEGPPGAKI